MRALQCSVACLLSTAGVGLCLAETPTRTASTTRGEMTFGAATATHVVNLRTGQVIPQGPSPRANVVSYDSLTRPGAPANYNLSWVDPNCYTNPGCTNQNAYFNGASSGLSDAWIAPLSPNTNQPMWIWGDDYSNDAGLWGGSDPNSTHELQQHIITPLVDNRGILDPNIVNNRALNVLFYDANVGTANPAAFVDGYAVNVPGAANQASGWVLTVPTAGGGINIPKDGTLVYVFAQRPPAVNVNSGGIFAAGGDNDPNAGAPPLNFPPPFVAVGANDMANNWFAVDPGDNIDPPAPANPPATIADVTAILNRNALFAIDFGLQGRVSESFAFGFPHRITVDNAPPCPCAGFFATGVCASDQDALDVVLFNFGSTGFPPFTNGDLDGDGDVDQDDLDIILFDFGCTG